MNNSTPELDTETLAADTRSLPVLDVALSVEQRRAYFGVVKEWWYLDRYGERRKITGDSAIADSYSGPLQLDEKQAAVFDAASLPDAVLHSLSLRDRESFRLRKIDASEKA
jgi:hypothetical protein